MFSALRNIMKPVVGSRSTTLCEADSSAPLSDIEECRRKMSIGDLDGAERTARSVLAASADNGEAWYQLGMIAYHRGDTSGALDFLRTAAELSPLQAEIQNHYGNALRVHGFFSEALDKYRRAADLKNGYAAPYYNMGLVETELGHPGEAASLFEQCLTIDPSFTPALITLGNLRLEQKDFRDAEILFRAVLGINPDSLEALNNLAIVLTKLKRCAEAVELCKHALTKAPESAELHNTIGIALRDLGRLDEAISSYRRALELNPVSPTILNNLGSALRETGKVAQAVSSLKAALVLKPDYATAWHNLGISLREQGELEEAVAAFYRALEVQPAYAAVLNDLGGALAAQGEIEEAVGAYRKAMESDSRFFVACSNMLLTMQYSSSYSAADIYRESLKYEALCAVAPKMEHWNVPDPDRRLRVGYVSPDFRCHSVSYFLHALFANHSNSEVALVCYSDVAVPDEHTDFYRDQADSWRNICGLSDEQVAKIVVEDRIDILVDLAGHTGQRLPLFAIKPAPLQVTWLGYPDTTGLQAVDYRFSDDLADPEGESDLYCTEKICRLPKGFLCYTAPLDAPEPVPLPSSISGHVTFGSFNNISKVTAEVVAVWCDLLKRVPESRLIIKNHSLADKAVRGRYTELFSQHGISSGRVELRARVKGTGSHLAMYGEIDIALDTFPYNGTTTTCEALWMGVPVITLAGKRHAARVGASILSRVGLADLVAESPAAYLESAETLARDLRRLSHIRSTLRHTMLLSSLCDGAGFAETIENIYRRIWRVWCEEHLKSN